MANLIVLADTRPETRRIGIARFTYARELATAAQIQKHNYAFIYSYIFNINIFLIEYI